MMNNHIHNEIVCARTVASCTVVSACPGTLWLLKRRATTQCNHYIWSTAVLAAYQLSHSDWTAVYQRRSGNGVVLRLGYCLPHTAAAILALGRNFNTTVLAATCSRTK
jgi:hypothetical protein